MSYKTTFEEHQKEIADEKMPLGGTVAEFKKDWAEATELLKYNNPFKDNIYNDPRFDSRPDQN